MPTIRLYVASKAKVDIDAVIYAATYNGGFGPRLKTPRELAAKQRIVYDEFNAAMEEAKGIVEVTEDRNRAVAIRIAGEEDIARYLIRSLIDQGFEIQFLDEENEYKFTSDADEILKYMFDMELEEFLVKHPEYMVQPGWIQLVYGNSPPELIANYSVKVEKFLVPTWKYIRSYYDPQFEIEEAP